MGCVIGVLVRDAMGGPRRMAAPQRASHRGIFFLPLCFAEALVYAANLIYNFRDVQNNAVDNTRQLSACASLLLVTDAELLPMHNFPSAAACGIHNLWLG